MPVKFRVVVVGGGGLLDFKVYLSPLLGEGDRSRMERLREGSRDVERGFREREREKERGETRGERRSIATIVCSNEC